MSIKKRFLFVLCFLCFSSVSTVFANEKIPVWFSLESNLGLNSESIGVNLVQSILINSRHSLADIKMTGVFDASTSNALKKFQSFLKVSETGIVDTSTRLKINEFLKKEYMLADSANLYCVYTASNRLSQLMYPGETLEVCKKLGFLNSEIKILPAALNGNVFPGDEIPPKFLKDISVITDSDYAIISWVTNESVSYKFSFGKSPKPINNNNFNSVPLSRKSVTSYSEKIQNLTPETQYFYSLYVYDGAGNRVIKEGDFRTLSVPVKKEEQSSTSDTILQKPINQSEVDLLNQIQAEIQTTKTSSPVMPILVGAIIFIFLSILIYVLFKKYSKTKKNDLSSYIEAQTKEGKKLEQVFSELKQNGWTDELIMQGMAGNTRNNKNIFSFLKKNKLKLVFLAISLLAIVFFIFKKSNHIQTPETEIGFVPTTRPPINPKVDLESTFPKDLTIESQVEAKKITYSDEELDIYGNALAKMFRQCQYPLYNGQTLLNTYANTGGCSRQFWPDPIRISRLIQANPNNQNMSNYMNVQRDLKLKNLLTLLTHPNCKKDFITQYILNSSSDLKRLNEEEFIRNLSCAGNIEIKRNKPLPE